MIDLFYPNGHNKPMKTLFLFLVFTILSACSTQKNLPLVSDPKKVEIKGGVWSLLSHDKLTLHFKNIETGKKLSLILERGISHRTIAPGHWELTGFEQNGKSYLATSSSKKFVLNIRPRLNVYSGSIVLGCPKITSSDFKYLKKMKFFNRYHFKSSSHTCELVVGNDLAGVKEELKNLHKSKSLNLIMGF